MIDGPKDNDFLPYIYQVKNLNKMAKIDVNTIITNILKFLPKYLHEKVENFNKWTDLLEIIESNESSINIFIKKEE